MSRQLLHQLRRGLCSPYASLQQPCPLGWPALGPSLQLLFCNSSPSSLSYLPGSHAGSGPGLASCQRCQDEGWRILAPAPLSSSRMLKKASGCWAQGCCGPWCWISIRTKSQWILDLTRTLPPGCPFFWNPNAPPGYACVPKMQGTDFFPSLKNPTGGWSAAPRRKGGTCETPCCAGKPRSWVLWYMLSPGYTGGQSRRIAGV